MILDVGNIYEHLPKTSPDEVMTILAGSETLKIKRIVSTGQSTPPGEWYEQEDNEWVIVLMGAAELLFEKDNGSDRSMVMNPGDYVMIPAGRRHRVESTSLKETTVWLAVHYAVSGS